jgi:hypothetical protein
MSLKPPGGVTVRQYILGTIEVILAILVFSPLIPSYSAAQFLLVALFVGLFLVMSATFKEK